MTRVALLLCLLCGCAHRAGMPMHLAAPSVCDDVRERELAQWGDVRCYQECREDYYLWVQESLPSSCGSVHGCASVNHGPEAYVWARTPDVIATAGHEAFHLCSWERTGDWGYAHEGPGWEGRP